MTTEQNPSDGDAWEMLDAEQRRQRTRALSIEEKLWLGQRLSAQAAALRRSILAEEPSDPRIVRDEDADPR
jgi:hypothetical protein